MVLYCGPQFSLARAFDMRSCYSALSVGDHCARERDLRLDTSFVVREALGLRKQNGGSSAARQNGAGERGQLYFHDKCVIVSLFFYCIIS